MEIVEAFAILNLSLESTSEEINKRYKQLSQIHHPDKGGSNEEFSRLKDAENLAIVYAENKSLMIVANHVYGTELATIEKKREVSNQINYFLNKTERRYRSKYQSYKEISIIFAAISGLLGVITNKSLPIFEMIPENYRIYLLFIAAFFGGMFLIINFKTSQLKDKIDELKEIFENKEDLHQIFTKIFSINNILTKREIYLELVNNSFDYEIHYQSPFAKLLSLPMRSNSMDSLIKLVGHEEFGKILILKGISNKMLTEIENKENNVLEIKYLFNK